TNLMKQQDTQGLIPYNSTQANNALIPYNRAQDPKLLAGNEAKLLEYKQTLNTLQKLEKSFKDFMSLPFSIIVDSKGNALPLTSQAIKNFIFHNLYKEFMSATKALNKPLAQLDFKPLSNEIKALPYKANANLKAHLRDINAKTNELLDSMQELKKSTKEIKLLAYHKPSENNANEVDRLSNVLGEISKTREYQVITDKKAFIENLNVLKRVAEPIPPTLDIQSFLKTLDNVENKENFIEHLSTRQDSQARLAYLNLVEPTLKRADIELTFLPNKKEYIKSFKDKDNNLLYLLATKDNDKTLITGIPNPAERYVKSEINKADIIHSFVPQDRQTTEVVNGLSTQNPTTKQEISKEIESKTTQDIEKKARMRRGIYSVYYEDIMIDFRKKYDPDDTLWFMKYAKLEKSDNGEQVYAALKHLNEIRDNVFIKYDDYVAATEKLTSSLKRAALDIIFETKDVSEAFEGIAKIETKLLDDYPFNQKRDTIQKENGITPSIKDTQQKERDKIIHSDSFTKGETLPLNSKENSSIKNTNELEKPTTKNYSLLRDNGFVKDEKEYILKYEQAAKEMNIRAERFEKEGNKEAVKILQKAAQEYKEKAQKLRENLSGIPEFEGYKPLSEFGTNYTEFIGDGKGAIQKLLSEAKDYETRKEAGSLTEDEVKQGAYKGQVAGAFYKEGLGDIDLVWGNEKIGLQKIVEKHLNDFADFAGNNPYKKMSNAINEIVENGKLLTENGVNTLWYKNGDDYYLVGLSKGFNGIGENEWIITSYEKRDLTANQKADINSKIQDSDTKALSPVSEFNELQSLNSTINSNSTTKDLIKQAKEQGLSQVQSNTNAQQLTLHDIQERLTARKKELEQQSKDLSTELKTQEKQANRVAPILKELLQKWRALNPLIIEWKERKEIRGKFGQFLGYEKKLSKRKPNLSNLEHIEKTLEAYKSYAKNNEDSAESVKKEISLLEDYVEKLKNKQNKQNIQNLIEHSQSKEQILSDERRKINTYHDLRQNFNKGHHTDLQILEGNNIPQEQHKQLLEFISQTRSYIESNFNINPLKEFGTNYAEFYKDGKGAIQKLLSEAKDYETRKEAGSLTEDEVKQGAYKGQV
ncbi:putative barnase/colicin E5 family endoribonuclease, partial [Helicobacter trogontum]